MAYQNDQRHWIDDVERFPALIADQGVPIYYFNGKYYTPFFHYFREADGYGGSPVANTGFIDASGTDVAEYLEPRITGVTGTSNEYLTGHYISNGQDLASLFHSGNTARGNLAGNWGSYGSLLAESVTWDSGTTDYAGLKWKDDGSFEKFTNRSGWVDYTDSPWATPDNSVIGHDFEIKFSGLGISGDSGGISYPTLNTWHRLTPTSSHTVSINSFASNPGDPSTWSKTVTFDVTIREYNDPTTEVIQENVIVRSRTLFWY
jgi:hypothetical protein